MIKANKGGAFFFGEMKYLNKAILPDMKRKDSPGFFQKLLGKTLEPEGVFLEQNLLINNGYYAMHGRGIYFDIEAGELFEGWFREN